MLIITRINLYFVLFWMSDSHPTTSSSTGPIDDLIVSSLQSLDKKNFGSKDKILFFKEISYLLNG